MRQCVPSFERIINGYRAILDMKNQRDKLRQYQKRITVLTDREKAIAKECLLKGDTNKAKLALRRKKYQEGLIQKTDAQLAQLEQLTSDVEFALVQKDVLYGLQQGTAVLKEIHKEMGGIENVEKLLGENAEARAYQEVRMVMFVVDLRHWLTVGITGNQRAPCKQDVKSGRRRSRRRARGPRTRSQRRHAARCTRQAAGIYAARESTDGERQGTEKGERAGCRTGAGRGTHVGIEQDAYMCIERGVWVDLDTAIDIDSAVQRYRYHNMNTFGYLLRTCLSVWMGISQWRSCLTFTSQVPTSYHCQQHLRFYNLNSQLGG